MPDTNVLVAAAITPRGVCGRLLEAALEGRWIPVVSPLLLGELTDVLARAKFRRWLSEDDAHRFVAGVEAIAEVRPDPPASPLRATPDPGDEFLVSLARVADVVALVSGDPHLTRLEALDPPAVTPADFVRRLGWWRRGDPQPELQPPVSTGSPAAAAASNTGWDSASVSA